MPIKIGDKFGRLTISGGEMIIGQKKFYACSCECGNSKNFRKDHLISGATESCGCLQKERASAANSKHRMVSTPEYNSWAGMIQRCYDVNSQHYKDWGARGITVCDTWRNDFLAFFADMGPRPTRGHSIDRIDNNGNYEPGNCRWATPKEQASNKRLNYLRGKECSWAKLTHENVAEIRTSSDSNTNLARRFGVTRTAIYHVKMGKNWAAQPGDALELRKQFEAALKSNEAAP